MPKKDRPRIDYMPGSAAVQALEVAAGMFPDMRPQAVLDKLVITGLCALRWKAPALYGDDRDRWKLPEELRPGNEPALTAK